MKLEGARVLVTRAVEGQDDAHGDGRGSLSELLRARGAVPVALPCIRFAWPEDEATLDQSLRQLAEKPADALVLASPQAVKRLIARMDSIQLPILSILQRMVIVAAGPGTARALKPYEHLRVLVPKQVGARGMLDALRASFGPLLRGASVAIPRAQGGSKLVEEALLAAGAEVQAFSLYRTLTEQADAAGVGEGLAALRAGQIDAITFGSGSAVRAFVELAGAQAHALCARTVIACMGESCAESARKLGLQVGAVAEGDFAALVDAMAAGPGTP